MIPSVTANALKHGISEDDIMHAYRNPIRAIFQNSRVLLIGGDQSGRFLEIGVEEGAERDVIVHAMPARERFLR